MQKDLMIEITANTAKAIKEIEQLKKEIKSFSENVKKGNVSLKTQDEYLNKVAKRLTQMAHAYASFSAIKGAVDIVADFEQSIAKLGAISGASKENLDKLKQKAEELGKSTMFSASEVAEGMNYLAMAGYKTKDIMASIGDVLNLAAVGQIDLGRASDIASNILSGFNLKAEETKRVVDVMTATITNANTNIPEMGEAMKYVAPQARALGVSLEETATAIGVLSNSGIKATMAGTGLSTMLVRLASPTGRAKEAINELGIKLYDANGKFVGLTEVLKQFKDKMKNMSQEMKAKYMRDIFGLETMKTAITLIDSVGNGYDELYSKIAKSMGVTEKKVKQMTDTFNGHMKELESAFQGLIITIGNELLPALTDFVKWLTNAVSTTEKFYSENKTLINTIVELTATFMALAKVRAIIESVLGARAAMEITKTTLSIKNLKQAVTLLGGALIKLGKANVALIALTLAIEGLNYAFDKWEEKIKKLDESTEKLKTSTKSFNEIMQTLQNSMKIDENGHKTFKLTREEIEKLKKETEDLIKTNEKRIKQLKEASDGSDEYKNMIAALEGQNKTLQATLKKLSTLKPYEKTKESAKEAKEAVKALSDEEIKVLTKTYQKRITEHSSTIEKLKSKEYDLAKKIEEIQTQLNNRLKQLETERLNAIEDIENKIHNLKMSTASSYEQYLDKQKQAEIKLAKAKEAIRNGDLAQAKRYMSQYENLMTSIANTEIKENGKVIVSKKQANAAAIAGLRQLESVTNEYYAKAKAQEEAAARAKIQNLKAELEATKAQLQLEVQRLNLEKQLIETLTGKKVDIDTSAALQSIKNLDTQIKQLDEKLKQKKDVSIDTNKAKAELKKVENTKAKVKITADTKPVVTAVMKITDKVTGKKRVIKFYADDKEPNEKVKKFDLKVKNLKPTVKVKSDISQALHKLSQIPKTITTIHYIKTVETHATGGIAGFRKVQGRIPGDDPLNSDDVPALLTRGEFVVKRDAVRHYGEDFLWKLNAKMLPKFATGGLVEIGRPQRLIENLKSNDNYRGSNGFVDDLEERFKQLIERISEYIENSAVNNNTKIKAHYGVKLVGHERDSLIMGHSGVSSIKRGGGASISDMFHIGHIGSSVDGTTKRTGNSTISLLNGELAKIRDDLTSKLSQYINDKNNIDKLTKEISNTKKSNLNKTMSEEEANNFNATLKTKETSLRNLENKLKTYEKYLDETENRIDNVINKLENKIRQIENKRDRVINRYSQIDADKFLPYGFEETLDENLINKVDSLFPKYKKLQNMKNEIKRLLSNFGIEESRVLPSNFDDIDDFARVNRFYNKLMTLNVPSKEEIKIDFQRFAKNSVNNTPRYLQVGYSLINNPDYQPISYNAMATQFLIKYGVSDSLLEYKIANLLKYNKQAATLSDDNLNILMQDILKQKLPKFATGGLIKLQNGGKLPGYGGGDRNLALLEDGEFVIRKEAVRTYGTDLFEKLNNFKLPKFATGGYVGNLPSVNNTSGDTVNVNFKFPDGANFEMQSDEMTAKQLESYFKRIM